MTCECDNCLAEPEQDKSFMPPATRKMLADELAELRQALDYLEADPKPVDPERAEEYQAALRKDIADVERLLEAA